MAAADMKLTPERWAEIEAFEKTAARFIRELLPEATDASPALRELLQSMFGAQIGGNDRREKLVLMLADLAAVVERVPDLERRLAALERAKQ